MKFLVVLLCLPHFILVAFIFTVTLFVVESCCDGGFLACECRYVIFGFLNETFIWLDARTSMLPFWISVLLEVSYSAADLCLGYAILFL